MTREIINVRFEEELIIDGKPFTKTFKGILKSDSIFIKDGCLYTVEGAFIGRVLNNLDNNLVVQIYGDKL